MALGDEAPVSRATLNGSSVWQAARFGFAAERRAVLLPGRSTEREDIALKTLLILSSTLLAISAVSASAQSTMPGLLGPGQTVIDSGTVIPSGSGGIGGAVDRGTGVTGKVQTNRRAKKRRARGPAR